MVYSLLGTFVFYALGLVTLPAVVAKELVDAGPRAVLISQAITLGFAAFVSGVSAWASVDIFKWAKARNAPKGE